MEQHSIQILYLEDNQFDLDLVQDMLVSGGIDCTIVRVDNREDFISALQQIGYDLILANYHLPSFDGIFALEITKELSPDTPFIIISDIHGEELAIEAMKSGATDYVIKYRLKRLVPAVQRAIRESKDRIQRRKLERTIGELERQTKDLEEKYRLLSERVRGFLRMDLPSGKFSLVDKFMENLSGYSIRDWYETPNFILTIIHPDYREYYTNYFEQMLEGIVPKMFEYKIIRKSGDERWWIQLNIGGFDLDGKLASISSVIIDNTENKEMQIKYRNLFENALVGMFRIDVETGEIIEANEKMAGVLGYNSVSELRAKVFFTKYLYQGSELQKLINRKLSLQEKPVIEDYPLQLEREDGSEIWVSLTVRLYPKEGFLEGIIVDITRRKRAEEVLLEQERALSRRKKEEEEVLQESEK